MISSSRTQNTDCLYRPYYPHPLNSNIYIELHTNIYLEILKTKTQEALISGPAYRKLMYM